MLKCFISVSLSDFTIPLRFILFWQTDNPSKSLLCASRAQHGSFCSEARPCVPGGLAFISCFSQDLLFDPKHFCASLYPAANLFLVSKCREVGCWSCHSFACSVIWQLISKPLGVQPPVWKHCCWQRVLFACSFIRWKGHRTVCKAQLKPVGLDMGDVDSCQMETPWALWHGYAAVCSADFTGALCWPKPMETAERSNPRVLHS